jgi:RNA polymerase sigma-70 factor (ECF subfamily)
MLLDTRLMDDGPADHQIIDAVLQGNSALFEVLIRRHGERAFRAARAMASHDQEAEDVVQQAFVTAFTQLRQFNARTCFGAWVTRIAINESAARRRRQQPVIGGFHETDRVRHPRRAARQRRQHP